MSCRPPPCTVPRLDREGMIGGGRFGTLAPGRSARALAAALGAELAGWDTGHRDAFAIAAHGRERFSPGAVGRDLLATLDGAP